MEKVMEALNPKRNLLKYSQDFQRRFGKYLISRGDDKLCTKFDIFRLFPK